MPKIKNKFSFFSFVLVLFGCFCAGNASAFLLPPGPMTPTTDPLTDVQMTIDYGVQVLNNATSEVTKLKQEQTKLTKSAKEKLSGKVEGLMPSKKDKNKKEKAIPGSKKIAECKIADIEKPSSVKEAFYKLFLAYPSDKEDVKSAYRKKAEEFYQDTIIETYVSSRELEKELDELEKNFTQLSPMLVTGEGGNGAETGEDNNGTWKNAYTAYDTMNELLKITEELAAMRAQLEAAKAVKNYIMPAAYQKEDKESSALDKRGNVQLAARTVRSGNEVLAFAQIDFNNFQKATVSTKETVSSNGGASAVEFAKKQRNAAVQTSRQEAIGLITGQSTVSTASDTEADVEEDEDYENYVYDPKKSSSVTYMTAPLPDISSPFDGNEEKMNELNKLDPLYEMATEALELHNLLQALPSYRENAKKYTRFKQLHNKSVEMLKKSDQCVLQYLDRYYTNPETVWTGGPISDENVANYDLRSGISGWAVKAFEVAKAETTSPVDSDDGIVTEIDVVDGSDMSKRSENEAAYKEKTQNISNPAENEKVEAINRETELIGWKIGAEAAKKLAEDQYSSNPQWGIPRKRFPIWNDQKNFYNQYLNGKYGNIKEYLASLQFNQAALTIAQELNDILIDDPEVKAYNARELRRLSNVVGDDDENEYPGNAEYDSLMAQKEAETASIYAKRDSALSPLQSQKSQLEADIEKASENLSSFNERINQLKKEKLSAQSSIEDLEVQLEQANDVAAYGLENGEEDEGDTVAQAYAKESIKENQAKEAAADPEIERYQKLAKEQEEKLNLLKSQLEQLEKQISAIEEAYVRQIQEVEEKYKAAFAVARQTIKNSKAVQAAKTLLSLYSEKVERAIAADDLIGTASVRSLISRADGLISDAKSYAVQAVETALADIYKLGDELYLPRSSAMVVKRHAELMKELQEISAKQLAAASSSFSRFSSNATIANTLTTLFQKVMTQKACAGGRCERADDEYFIGLYGKDKDFSAPKAAPDGNIAPVREIVRFDTVSYDNVPKAADGTVSRQGFLNYGEEIPAIWQTILQEDVFVERDVDLAAILEAGYGREGFFMRGGRYPCRLGRRIIDVDPYDGQYMVVSRIADADGIISGSSGGNNNSESNVATREFLKKIGVYIKEKVQGSENTEVLADERNLPQCQEIEIIGHSGLASKFYYTVRDIEADTEGPAAIHPRESIGNPSELGTLLKVRDGGSLAFANKPQEVFARLKEINEEQNNSSSEYKTNLQDEIFGNAPYNINQIGDFLDYVEVEMAYRQSLEELKANLDEANELLKEQLIKAGFTPTADFDIAADDDYELAVSNLDKKKNELVEEAFSGISGVNAADNEVVEERLNKIKRIFTALRKDKDELLPLNENSPSDSELDEQIKTEEVNKSVIGEYDKKVEEEFQKQLNNFKLPFCAAY